jgi:hypothetical protein
MFLTFAWYKKKHFWNTLMEEICVASPMYELSAPESEIILLFMSLSGADNSKSSTQIPYFISNNVVVFLIII